MSSARKLMFGDMEMEKYPAMVNQKLFHPPGKSMPRMRFTDMPAQQAPVFSRMGYFRISHFDSPPNKNPPLPKEWWVRWESMIDERMNERIQYAIPMPSTERHQPPIRIH